MNELLDLALRTAREAGELIEQHRRNGVDVAATKSSAVDVVTAADQASETLIRNRVLAARPDDCIVGEEGDDVAGTSGVRWIVDPIDGTVNFLYGIEQYAVSIAAEVDGEVAVGVVLNPATGETFSAIRGQGARRNDEPIEVRIAADLTTSLVATGFNYAEEVRARQGASVARLLPQVRDIRREGSCALDLCSLAMGRVDGYVEEGVQVWDWAAGRLIGEEAGARVVVRRNAFGNNVVVAAAEAAFDRFDQAVAACGFGC